MTERGALLAVEAHQPLDGVALHLLAQLLQGYVGQPLCPALHTGGGWAHPVAPLPQDGECLKVPTSHARLWVSTVVPVGPEAELMHTHSGRGGSHTCGERAELSASPTPPPATHSGMTHVRLPAGQPWASAGLGLALVPGTPALSTHRVFPHRSDRHPAGPDAGLPGSPVVEGGAAVVVKVKGMVDGAPGHSMALRVMVPLFPQTAVKQAPSPSVVL